MNLKKRFTLFLSFLLAAIVVLTSFGTSAEAATHRTAKIDQVIGTVTIQKAGGHLTMSAYEGMLIQEGDRVRTSGEFSSAHLIFTDTKDEITIANHADVVFTDLRMEAGSHLTRLTVRSGAVLSSVIPFKNEQDVFEVNTPGQTMSAKGTNFFVGVDPRTGESFLTVFSGIVQANRGNDTNNEGAIYPGQQVWNNPSLPDSDLGDSVTFPDIDELVKSQTPAVIEELLKAMAKIREENNDFTEKIRKEMEESGDGPDAFYGVENKEDFERYVQNLQHLIERVVQEAIDQRRINPDRVREIIRDLDLPPEPIMPNPADMEKQKRNKERLEEQRKALEEARRVEKEKLAEQTRNAIEQLRLQKEKQQREIEEAKRKKAEELLKRQAIETEKVRLEQEIQNRLAERERQSQARDEVQRRAEPTPPPPPSRPAPPPPLRGIELSNLSIQENGFTAYWYPVEGAAVYQVSLDGGNTIAGEVLHAEGDLLYEVGDLASDIKSYRLKINALDASGKVIAQKTIDDMLNFGVPILAEVRATEDSNHLLWEHVDSVNRYELFLDNEYEPIVFLVEDGYETGRFEYDLETLENNQLYWIQIKAYTNDEVLIALKTFSFPQPD